MPHEQKYRLQAHERPKFMYVYYASGHGIFPFDMLRHDCAWPAQGEDAAKLEWERMGSDKSRGHRTLKIHSYRVPTVERWHSFGWAITSEKPEG